MFEMSLFARLLSSGYDLTIGTSERGKSIAETTLPDGFKLVSLLFIHSNLCSAWGRGRSLTLRRYGAASCTSSWVRRPLVGVCIWSSSASGRREGKGNDFIQTWLGRLWRTKGAGGVSGQRRFH